MSEGPLDRYERDLQKPGFQADAAQRRAVEHLQLLFRELQIRRPGGWRQLFARSSAPKHPVRGLYLWGGVGRGKTYLMDTFFEALPFPQKLRTHFHRFMRRVHAELSLLKGEKNPLEKVADVLAGEARVICFDEFFVADITDAMILANLFRALFARGVTLVATSNVEPANLYKDGLQRVRFLPAIDLLREHMTVLNVDGGTDYRLRALVKAELYYFPLGSASERALEECFLRLVPDSRSIQHDLDLAVEGRMIRALREAEDVVWFDFRALCDGPRSQHDYIVLAKEYHAVLVSNVPELGQRNEDQARRFIYLVDEFYDRSVKLVLSAAMPLDALYGDGRLRFEFQRTQSRLLEMQSQEYLALPHKA